jgi:hypothetical protein
MSATDRISHAHSVDPFTNKEGNMGAAKYICFRFYVVPTEEDHLLKKAVGDSQKIKWFKEAFLENRDYRRGAQNYAIRVTKHEGDYFYGKLSKKHLREIHPITSDDIKSVIEEDWPYLEFLCDCAADKQVVVIEYNSMVIHRVSAVKNILEYLVGGGMFQHGYSIRFEPIIDETTFWNLVETSGEIYSLSFLLNSPNFLCANEEANNALKGIRKVFNNTRVRIDLENEQGKLKAPREVLETYRDYADKGGGEWTITTKTAKQGARKLKHVSSQRAIKIPAEKKDGQTMIERLKSVYERFRRII